MNVRRRSGYRRNSRARRQARKEWFAFGIILAIVVSALVAILISVLQMPK
ncbi:MAG: hypothetical protein ACTSVU_08830 [Promethearchaeota archaeon]